MAAAPSVVWLELPAVMSFAVSGSHDCAGGSAAIFSSATSGRMPSSASSTSPVNSPSSSLIGTGRISLAKWPHSVAAAARRCDSTANSSISCARDAPLVGQFLRDAELGVELPVDFGQELLRERAGAPTSVARHRHPRHRLDAARDREVVHARHNRCSHEMHRLLRRTALAVDRRGGCGPRQSAGDHGVAPDVAALLA